MAHAENTELLDAFEQFYRDYYRNEIGELAQKYPAEQKSLYVDWGDLYRFDPDLADDYRQEPEQFQQYAEEALRTYDLPVDVKLGGAHVRMRGLPGTTEIREIRADHRGRLIAVQGIVRKATDVRPKVREAAFECQRCGTLTRVPQTGGTFQEPHECRGCERQGPFRINFDQSEFVDAQKIRIQESPEGLRGGETPQSIDVHIEDDITGRVTAGDHVSVTGVLHLDGSGNRDSPIFDVYMDGVTVEIEDEQFEEMDITEEDKRAIVDLSTEDDVYGRMIDSIAPSIYGYDEEKLAIILQLFSGVTKHLPDGSRTRGDLHVLLIGDPGTGKSEILQYIRNIAPRSVYTSGKGSSAAGLCVTGDTLIHTRDGFRSIRDIAEREHPRPVNDDTSAGKEIGVYSFDRDDGGIELRESSHVWRMPEKQCRRIETAHGKDLEASVYTPVLTCGENGIEWKPIADVDAGDYVAVPRYDDVERTTPPIEDYLELTNEKVLLGEDSLSFVRRELVDRFGTLRDAASELGFSEDFIYSHLWNRYVPVEKLDMILDTIGATRSDVSIDRAMLRHGESVRIPDGFDEDLMYLVGLVFGDGDIAVSRRGDNRGLIRISNSDEDLLRRAADIIERTFDKRVEIEYQEGKVPCIRLSSATIARFMQNAGMRTPKKELALDERLTTANYADAFLRGLMDADGSVSVRTNGGSGVHFSTISETLARQVQAMLETYGVRARKRKRDPRGTHRLESGQAIESKHVQHHVELFGANIERFAEAIGFESAEKRAALERIVGDARREEETVPIGAALATVDGSAGQYYNPMNRGDNPGRGRAGAMLEDLELGQVGPIVEEVIEANLRWDEVVAAVDIGTKEVFDLTVPETHNFIGNGVVTHNTAAAVRDDFGDGQQWSLEAGALVLADQGIAAVDELDKMRCVTGDTLVQKGDGGIVPIRELVYDTGAGGTVEALENGRTVRGVDATVRTMTSDGRLVSRPVRAVHEYDAPDELYEVTLESGESVTATADHPFFVLDRGERVEKPAADLDEGDWAFVPGCVPTAVTDGGAVAASFDESAGSATGLSPAEGAVLGYLAGDGNLYYDRDEGVYGIRFTNKEDELVDHFRQACRDAFGDEAVLYPSERRADGVKTVHLRGKAYVDELLDAGANLEIYEGKRLPTGVTTASRPTKAAFLRALADSEGWVDEQSRNVKISSSSYQLVLGAKMLLLEFGITSQIQTREREHKRDVYLLAITAKPSLEAFHRHIGFTLARKHDALESVRDSVSGDRTIIDVLPECGHLFERARRRLRLYQAECGLNGATYCDFENGAANASLRKADRILDAFERRREQARRDRATLETPCSWETLETLRERYHVSQRELAAGMGVSQPEVSRRWGSDHGMKERIRTRLHRLLDGPATADVERLCELVRGDVRWRRVTDVRRVHADEPDDGQAQILRHRIAELLGLSTADDAVETGRDVLEVDPAAETWKELRNELDRHDISFQQVADALDVAGSTVSRWFNGVVDVGNFGDVRRACFDRIRTKRDRLRELIEEIEARGRPKVYDLTVEGTHNFVANGMVIHNSEDRSAMHEALEQQSISISKAGINATLKSRCSLLGAANPKYGRFDQYESIAEQIELEPALISRFDLIFTVTDHPDEERDRELAEHILTTNYAGELNTYRRENNAPDVSREQVEQVTREVAPAIEPDLLRKYVAYAKRSCFPRMTEEAKAAIRDFYVDLRSKGQGEDAPVPVTARKLEALVRLAEASARVRLSDTVEKEDAERVIEIVRSCLKDVGIDPETGEFDADVIEAGTSKSQRERIKSIKGLIEDIQDEYEEGAPVEEVLDRAEETGMERSKAEHEIESLKRKGEVYEPRTNHLRTT